MSAYKRALLYMKRKTGKTVLLLITFFVIVTLVLLGLSIHTASEKAAAQLRENFGGYFKISTDYQKMSIRQQMDDTLVRQLMKLDGIKSYNAMNTYYMSLPELMLKPGKFTIEGDRKAQLTRLLGNTESSMHEYFLLDILELAEGEHLKQTDEKAALISAELAELNGLTIGDTITANISEDSGTQKELIGTAYTFTIKGIFSEVTAEEGDDQTPECDLPANFIFIDGFTSNEIGTAIQGGEKLYTAGVTFFASDPKNLNSIVSEVQQLNELKWDSLKLTVNNAAYLKSAEPLGRLSGMMSLMVALIVVISIILLSLLLTMQERDRVQEAGVLMSFGIRKRNILLQHLLEKIFIFLIACCLSVIICIPLTSYAGRVWHGSITKTAEGSGDERSYLETSQEPVDLENIETEVSIDARLKPLVVLISGVIGIMIVSISVGFAFLVIARRKPKELLTIME